MPVPHRLVLLSLIALSGACRSGTSPDCPQDMRSVPDRSVPGVSTFCQTSDGKRAQWIEFYDKKGAKRQSCGFANGMPEGSFTAWHPSGKPWVQGIYVNGKKARQWKQWDASGSLVAEGEYRDGRLISGAPVAGMAGCESVLK